MSKPSTTVAAIALIAADVLVTGSFAQQSNAFVQIQQFTTMQEACAGIASRMMPSTHASIALAGYRPYRGDTTVMRCQYDVTLSDGSRRTVLGPPIRNPETEQTPNKEAQ